MSANPRCSYHGVIQSLPLGVQRSTCVIPQLAPEEWLPIFCVLAAALGALCAD
jgi:hypothetical protein